MSDKADIPAEDVELPAPLHLTPHIAGRSVPPSESRTRTVMSPAQPAAHATSQSEFKAAERERILSALTACNWNRLAAAKMIGVPRRTFYRRLKEFGIL
jgi:transcriptional regulator of acetoin/glycerol metabolism